MSNELMPAIHKKSKHDDWVSFSQSYLQLARLGCDEILKSKHGKKGFRNRAKFRIHAQDIFIPILFNIKHGIEIFTKSLKLTLVGELSGNDLKHNISELFLLLKVEIKKHNILVVIQREREATPQDINIETAYNSLAKIPEFLAHLEVVIGKYYHCDVFKEKLESNFTIEDIDNTAFRYPDNSLKIKMDYDKVLERITDSDVR